MRVFKYQLFIFIACVLVACSDNSKCTKPKVHKVINPNGDSELALLMREMFTHSDSLRQLVLAGRPLSGLHRFTEIHTATPTDSTVSGPTYQAFAAAYIQSISELETVDAATVFNFNNMVDQCMSCHTEFCPGPKKRIKKLYITAE